MGYNYVSSLISNNGREQLSLGQKQLVTPYKSNFKLILIADGIMFVVSAKFILRSVQLLPSDRTPFTKQSE